MVHHSIYVLAAVLLLLVVLLVAVFVRAGWQIGRGAGPAPALGSFFRRSSGDPDEKAATALHVSNHSPPTTVCATNQETSLYRLNPEEHCGGLCRVTQKPCLWYKLYYDEITERLLIDIIKVRGLKHRHHPRGNPNPCIVFKFTPDFPQQKIQTKVMRNTKAPKFNQAFYVHLAKNNLQVCTLTLTLLDVYDEQMNHFENLGSITFPLHNMELFSKDVIIMEFS